MRNRYILPVDVFLVALAAVISFALRLDWFFIDYRRACNLYVLCAVLTKPLVFLGFGLYQRYWRYATIRDLFSVMLAVSAASVIMTAAVVAGLRLQLVPLFPRSILLIDWLVTLAFISAVRLSIRVVSEGQTSSAATRFDARPSRRVLVAGAGDAGTMVVREMQRNPQLGLTPVGFLDDAPAKLGKRIHGVPVLGTLRDLARVVDARGIQEVAIAMPRAAGKVVRHLVDECRSAGVESRVIPGVYELLGGSVSVSRLRQVEITDLLRRSPVQTDSQGIGYLTGRAVLITGAGGSIGYEICRQVGQIGPAHLILLGRGENSIYEAEMRLRELYQSLRMTPVIADVANGRRIEQIFDRFRPDVVFHAAAHKHVPLMQANPWEAITGNVLGTVNVVRAATRAGTDRLVLVSTDKAVAPSSVMGASKLVAEMVVRDAAQRSGRAFSIVRFGNVLGSRGSVVPHFKRQIERGGPISITHPEMTRFFMTIPEAVHLVLQGGGLSQGGELFVLNMGEPVRIVDLADDLVRLSGFVPGEIPVVFTGLRPGEKLVESLWEWGTVLKATANPDIRMVTDVHSIESSRLAEAIRRLEAAAAAGNAMEIHSIFAEIIPTYRPPVMPPVVSDDLYEHAPREGRAPALQILDRRPQA